MSQLNSKSPSSQPSPNAYDPIDESEDEKI